MRGITTAPEALHGGPDALHGVPEELHGDPEELHGDPEELHRDPEELHRDPEELHRDPEELQQRSVAGAMRMHRAPSLQSVMPPSLTDRLQSLLGSAFRLDRELTGGGMSRVFVAHEPALKREVVVKVLPPDLVTRESVARFEREVAVTAQLQHPHILPVITTGGADDIYYYVAPYIHGESLRARLGNDGKIPFDECIRLVSELLGAVGFAHARGIIHRDIKPGNILLSEGHAILADFGIARALAGPDDGRLTMTGGAMGTPSYMAPEHPRDEQADLYAVAVVAHEMLTGALPKGRGDLPRTTAEVATAVSKAGASRAKGVAAVLARAMSIDSAKRFRTAREFRDAWEGAASVKSTGLRLAVAAAAIVLIGAVSAPWVVRNSRPLPFGYANRVAVLPVRGPRDIDADSMTRAVRDALTEWIGVQVVAGEAVARTAGENLESSPGDIARRLSRSDAPTVVLASSIEPTPAGFRMTASAFAPDGRLLRTSIRDLPSGDRRLGGRVMANVALRTGDALPWRDSREVFSANLESWRAVDSSETLVRALDLSAADAQLATAIRLDSNNVFARFQRAKLLSFIADPGKADDVRQSWADLSQRLDRLHPTDRASADAWLSLQAGDFSAACRQFESLSSRATSSHEAWLGLGDCRRFDNSIVTRGGSLVFRSGWHSAATAYERAIASWPGVVPRFAYRRLAGVLQFQMHRVRIGEVAGSSGVFAAMPALINDTLGHTPHGVGAAPLRSEATTSEAAARNGARLRIAVQRWLLELPNDAEAHLLHAEILEAAGALEGPASGERSALSEARESARLATIVTDRVRGRAAAIRILLKLRRWSDARSEADSALAAFDGTSPALADLLSPLAALRGNEELLRRMIRIAGALPRRASLAPDGSSPPLSPALAQLQADVAAGAILGRCDESFRNRLRDFQDQINAFEPDRERRGRLHTALIGPLLELSVPCLGYEPLRTLGGTTPISVAQRAVANGNLAAALSAVRTAAVSSSGAAALTSADFSLRSAWIELAAVDTAAAVVRVDRTLAGLISASPLMVTRDVDAASFVRLLRLASELHARREGKASFDAVRWSAAADTLTRD